MEKLLTTRDFIKRVAANMNPGPLEGGQDQSPLSFDDYQKQVAVYAEAPLSGQDGFISDYSPTDSAGAFNGYPTTYSGTDVFQEEAKRHYEVGGQNGYRHKTEDGSPPILDWLFNPVDGDTVSNPMRSDFDTGAHGEWRNKNASTFKDIYNSTTSNRNKNVIFQSMAVEPRLASGEEEHAVGRFIFNARSVTGKGMHTVDLQFMNKAGEEARPVTADNLDGFDLKLNCTCPFYKFYGPAYYANKGRYQILDVHEYSYRNKDGKPYDLNLTLPPKNHGEGQKICKHILSVFRSLRPALAVSGRADIRLEKSVWKVTDPDIFRSGKDVEFWRDKMELNDFSQFTALIHSKTEPWQLRMQLDKSMRKKSLNYTRWFYILGDYFELEESKGLSPHGIATQYMERCEGIPLAALFLTRYVYHHTDYPFRNNLIGECFDLLNKFVPSVTIGTPAEAVPAT